MAKGLILLASLFGLTGVGLGAFAAHGLKQVLSAAHLAVFQTAVQYQLLHALALLAVGILLLLANKRAFKVAGVLFVAGIVLFSGSLYVLTLTGLSRLGMVTPLGGLLLMGGWISLGLGALGLVARQKEGARLGE